VQFNPKKNVFEIFARLGFYAAYIVCLFVADVSVQPTDLVRQPCMTLEDTDILQGICILRALTIVNKQTRLNVKIWP